MKNKNSKVTVLRKQREQQFQKLNETLTKEIFPMKLTENEIKEATEELQARVEENLTTPTELTAADFEDRRVTKDRRTKKKGGSKRAYGFEESLAIIKLLNENRSLDDISGLVKRSPYSLNYKFFDKKRGYKGSRSFGDICKAFDKELSDSEARKVADDWFENFRSQVESKIPSLSN